MATRPIFVPVDAKPCWSEHLVVFDWFAGFALSQKQKSIASLHAKAKEQLSISNPIEISTRSEHPLGISLSAFNLSIEVMPFGRIPLECVFQGSKTFRQTGKLDKAYKYSPKDAKAATNEVNRSDQLTGFELNGYRWPLEPKTWFYDWLYLRAIEELDSNTQLELTEFDAFTDIEFNPAKSFNCQARSCAIAVSLIRQGKLELAIRDPNYLLKNAYQPLSEEVNQQSLQI